MRRADAFDMVAEDYDRYRPSYPPEFCNAITEAAGCHNPSVLEVGAGTGIATAVLADGGCSVTALEPGPRLAALARRRVAWRPNIVVLQSTFEKWTGPAPRDDLFDIVFSADAWHWIEPSVRLRQTRQVLRSGGLLALVWHRSVALPEWVAEALADAYRRWAPELLAATESPPEFHVRPISELNDSPWFELVDKRIYRTYRRLSATEYTGLLSTYSDHVVLEHSRRTALFETIQNVIDDQLEGEIEKADDVLLFTARLLD